jgi:pimeloyl-ACP methyl ester carboxylesterase
VTTLVAGVSSVTQDVEELDALLGTIDGRVVLIGHSTGCQDIAAYLKSGAGRGRVTGAVMQGAVSDRQAMGMECGDEAVAAAAGRAAALVSRGDGEQLMPRDTPGVFNTPITAARYASLAGRMTADDMFSGDLSDLDLAAQLGHMTSARGAGVQLLWAFSGSDEYVPDSVKEDGYQTLASRISAAAAASATSGGVGPSISSHVVIEGGSHSLDGEPGVEFVGLVCGFLGGLPPPPGASNR